MAPVTHIVFFFARQPGAYVWLMVIMEMVKELTGEEAFTVHPHEVERRLDVFNPDVVGKAFDDGEELLKNVLRFIQDFAHRAPAIGLIDPGIDFILSL